MTASPANGVKAPSIKHPSHDSDIGDASSHSPYAQISPNMFAPHNSQDSPAVNARQPDVNTASQGSTFTSPMGLWNTADSLSLSSGSTSEECTPASSNDGDDKEVGGRENDCTKILKELGDKLNPTNSGQCTDQYPNRLQEGMPPSMPKTNGRKEPCETCSVDYPGGCPVCKYKNPGPSDSGPQDMSQAPYSVAPPWGSGAEEQSPIELPADKTCCWGTCWQCEEETSSAATDYVPAFGNCDCWDGCEQCQPNVPSPVDKGKGAMKQNRDSPIAGADNWDLLWRPKVVPQIREQASEDVSVLHPLQAVEDVVTGKTQYPVRVGISDVMAPGAVTTKAKDEPKLNTRGTSSATSFPKDESISQPPSATVVTSRNKLPSTISTKDAIPGQGNARSSVSGGVSAVPAPRPETYPNANPQVKSGAKAELEAMPQPEYPEAKSETQIEAKSEAKLEDKSRVQDKAELEADAKTGPKSKLETNPVAKVEAQAKPVPEVKSGVPAEAKPQAKGEAQHKTKSEAMSEIKRKTQHSTRPEAQPRTQPDNKPIAKPEAKSGTPADTSAEAEAKAQSQESPETKQEDLWGVSKTFSKADLDAIEEYLDANTVPTQLESYCHWPSNELREQRLQVVSGFLNDSVRKETKRNSEKVEIKAIGADVKKASTQVNELRAQMHKQMREQMNVFRTELHEQMCNQVHAKVQDSFPSMIPLANQLDKELGKIRADVCREEQNIRIELREQIREQITQEVDKRVYQEVRYTREQIRGQITQEVDEQVNQEIHYTRMEIEKARKKAHAQFNEELKMLRVEIDGVREDVQVEMRDFKAMVDKFASESLSEEDALREHLLEHSVKLSEKVEGLERNVKMLKTAVRPWDNRSPLPRKETPKSLPRDEMSMAALDPGLQSVPIPVPKTAPKHGSQATPNSEPMANTGVGAGMAAPGISVLKEVPDETGKEQRAEKGAEKMVVGKTELATAQLLATFKEKVQEKMKEIEKRNEDMTKGLEKEKEGKKKKDREMETKAETEKMKEKESQERRFKQAREQRANADAQFMEKIQKLEKTWWEAKEEERKAIGMKINRLGMDTQPTRATARRLEVNAFADMIRGEICRFSESPREIEQVLEVLRKYEAW